jgi:pyrroline-5-carboxylate reductase
MKLGILGATGWLGQALGLRLIGQGLWPAGDLVVLNRSGRAGGYAGHPVVWARDAADLCAQSDVLVLSVRPGDFPPAGFDAGDRLVISFMTAWRLADLQARWPQARIVRAMPNGGAPVGQSYTPWIGEVGPEDAALVAHLLSAMGGEDRLGDEAHLDYMTALSGSGSAYPALMAQAMLEDALARGLPEAVAQRAVEAVVCGSAPFLAGRMGDLPAILDAYLSYRGVTAAGIAAAQPGLETAIRAALQAATAKAAAMTP